MSRFRLVATLIALLGGLAVSACGGGGTGFSVENDPISVTSTSLPILASGQRVDHVIPLAGGCGGPYVLSVIEGALPAGLSLNDERHAIEGLLLEDGTFDVTIQVVDSGCDPFSSTTARFSFIVPVGDVAIVDALLDGVPSLLPAGATSENPDYAALPTVVYNSFNSISMLVAGGVPPYSLEIIEDPSVPEAGGLPLGTSIPPGSTTILGAPVEVGPDGGPFVVLLEATDAVGSTGTLAVQWKVDTPPVLIATDQLADGQCGTEYHETVFTAEGVPPFTHELVAQGLPEGFTQVMEPETGDVVYHPGGPPTVTPTGALDRIDASVYPAPDAPGPDYAASRPGAPPEGIRLDEDTGLISGVPRRRGTFVVHYHVRSTLVPDSFGQHNWASFSFHFLEAPAVVQDPGYTLDGAFPTSPPYARIAPAEQGLPYNPDSTSEPVAGLQLLASGGVSKDGYTDAPHASQASTIEGAGPGQEQVGAYDWDVDYDPDGDGGNVPIPSMDLTGHLGVWGTTDPAALVPQLEQELEFTVMDQQLPLQVRHESSQKVRFEVGPDVVIITESTTSYSGTGSANTLMNDPNMTVRVLVPYTNGAQVRDLKADDLSGEGSGQHVIPATAGTLATIDTLLSGVDLLRVSVNPTGWWDDLHGLNARSARTMQHGDRNAYLNYYGMTYNGSTSSSSTSSGCQPSATSVQLPKCTSPAVVHDPHEGVYADGGQLYVFNSQKYFGAFIIRKDSSIYVPTAFDKTTFTNFGDNWNQDWSTSGTHSLIQIPQMTVSPDGRFAAMKLKRTFSRLENAGSTRIVLFSLTGERPAAWGGSPYRILETGSSGGSSTGQYQFASSLTLTNQYLYYVIGSGDTRYLSWKDHYFYRYELLGGASAGAFLHPNHSSDWTNTTGQPMQSPFQRFREEFRESTNRASRFMVSRHGYNATEVSMAPSPFRVNADGDTCAIIAGVSTTATSTSSSILLHHVWVDRQGTLYRLSSTRRHCPQGGGRGTALRDGPETTYTFDWGSRSGPTSAFALSDDGLRVAVVVNRDTSVNPNRSYSTTPDWTARDDIVAFEASNGTSWAGGVTEIQVTGNESTPSNAIFSSAVVWRFGALTFTRAGDGLVFWGGFSGYRPGTGGFDSTYGRYRAKSFVGSLYSYDFANDDVRGILAASDGGHKDGANTLYSTSNKVTVTNAEWTTTGGVVKPIGGFISNNGNFRYIVNMGAVNSSARQEHQLIGVNIRSLDQTQAINGHTDGLGFLVAGMPSNRGFLPKYSSSTGSYSYGYYGIGCYTYSSSSPSYYGTYAPGGSWGSGLQVAAEEGGRVYFAGHYQRGSANTITTLSTDYRYGGPIHRTTHYDRGYYSGQVLVFDADVGGQVHQLTTSQLGSTSTSTLRAITYLEVSPDGRAVSVVYGTSSVAYPRERLSYVGGVELNPTDGSLVNSGFVQNIATASNGRVSSAVAFGPSGTKLYYANGTSNENAKALHSREFDASGSPTADAWTFATRNYNVLHAGR